MHLCGRLFGRKINDVSMKFFRQINDPKGMHKENRNMHKEVYDAAKDTSLLRILLKMAIFGQLVVGAPGAGKSTYCTGLMQILEQLKRPTLSINLDPANDILPFKPDIDIRELITVEDAMENLGLGPNGALRYCMQTLEKNIEWLRTRVGNHHGYLVVDMPGQLELYNSDDSIAKIMRQFEKWDWRFCSVHLSDSIYCSDPGKFISVVLSALSIMVNLEIGQINVLSKTDLLHDDFLPYEFDFFEQLPDLGHLVRLLDDHPFLVKYKKLSEKLCEVIEDYSLVNFVPLDVSNKEKMVHLLKLADNANGFALADTPDIRDIIVNTK